MTAADRNHILEKTAKQECVNLLLSIILACDQRVWWLARIMECP